VLGAEGQPVANDLGRAVNRKGSFSVGVRGGTYQSGYFNGGSYGDLSLGLAARYRPVEALGFELAWSHASDSWDEQAERQQDPLSASVEFFAFPWTRVSPYALAGVTAVPRAIADDYRSFGQLQHADQHDTLFGPHTGVGIEFAVGKTASINLEARWNGFVGIDDDDPSLAGSAQLSSGVNFYF
jgi:opacity protein-like surface antigen